MNMANFDFRSMKLLLLNLLVCCILPLFLMVLLRRGALALPISGLILMIWGDRQSFLGICGEIRSSILIFFRRARRQTWLPTTSLHRTRWL